VNIDGVAIDYIKDRGITDIELALGLLTSNKEKSIKEFTRNQGDGSKPGGRF
jgi:hypothetical protein